MYEVSIERVVAGGDGLARIDGRVCLIPYALPGDRLSVENVSQRRGVLHATIERVLEASQHRADTECAVFGQCGGCSWLHFAYPGQAEWKRRIVAECFERIAKTGVDVGWLEDPELRLGYRTRATFHARAGAWGFYGRNSHRVVDIEGCPLCHDHLNAALRRLRGLSVEGDFDVTVDPEGEAVLLWAERAGPAVRKAFPQTNTPKDPGPPHSFRFDGAPVVNGGFSQASLLLNRLLVSKVRALVGDAASVLDLYCGAGNLSLGLAGGRDLLGIDRHDASIWAASEAGAGRYLAGDESAFRTAIAERDWDTIILDPPRQGAKRIMPALAESRAGKIVYVSCDPATLARDSKTLLERGWRLGEVTAIDLFPHTPHVESVAQFVRAGC